MPKTATLTVLVADLPEVKSAIAALTEDRDELRALCQVWEQRVNCPQCGQRYHQRACGPTHALVWHLVKGETE